jgi:cell fate regulator YaaT (PSP1 superfamily)
MVTVVGVRFREVGKIYYFAPGDLVLKRGDHVIVDTARGQEYGTVMLENRQVEDEDIVPPLKAVDRIATKDDEEREAANRDKEKDAFNICKARIREHNLEMKLISAEYAFDNSKILFCFTADGRVDFRDLVKDLASIFKIRIELRQVGVRDETKIMGGIGYCGRPLCCCSYLSDFVPVSIRMAKEQNLSLNPQKISGMCGRLMCCLKNEVEAYEDLNTRLPKQGAKVQTKDGREGVAQNVNVLRETIQVLFTDEKGNREMEEFPASELKFTPRRKKPACEACGNCAGSDAPQDTAGEDVTEELAEEAAGETDPELRELETEELSDMKVETQQRTDSARTSRRRRRSGDRSSRQGSQAADDAQRKDHTDRADRTERTERTDRTDRQDREKNQHNSRSNGPGNAHSGDGQSDHAQSEHTQSEHTQAGSNERNSRNRRRPRRPSDAQHTDNHGTETAVTDKNSDADGERKQNRENNFRRRPRRRRDNTSSEE